MGNKFADIAFTETVKSLQEASGSRRSYARMEAGADTNCLLGSPEASFIASRDSLYMATVGETGWPHVQHRGGPTGFVKVLDKTTLGFADFQGNRQHVSVGNLMKDDRVSLIFMDYPNRAGLKILGRARLVELEESDTLEKLALHYYLARVERGIVIKVEAFDWNCPQHITPRFTAAEFDEITE